MYALGLSEDPKDPHLRPLWFSDPQKSDIHLIEAEVDSGAGCNTFPLYVYQKIFGAAPMDRPSVNIKAYGDQPASIGGNGLHQLSSSKTANTTVKTYSSRGEDKPSKYICNFVKVCSGERGKAILRESNAHKEAKDYQVIIKALEQKVKPSNEELSANSEYFYLRQGNVTLVDFFKQATEIVEAMNIDEDPKDKTLRNLLMNGLTSREIYRECLKEKADQLSSKRVMEIASNIEARNLMVEDFYLNLYHVASVVEESDVDDKNAQPRTPNATSVERWDIGARPLGLQRYSAVLCDSWVRLAEWLTSQQGLKLRIYTDNKMDLK
ncbi:hypothetical protein CAPTEDRAFT_193501 [Capitella teleta]|uniref:Uncharacterized protein n=1 Tax=Capitella teleta TaxID=283909 RepID=R7TAA6_CAPTE|nr:hypothetical protein CAPTEDRAFT_193501 [Capitella teleta]|eukprot:ELT90417.1 hypothetical protein CAPTEDRAFT_193501 [Capitella teleta]